MSARTGFRSHAADAHKYSTEQNMFKIGDRVRPAQAHGGYYVPATVTELTDLGFKYVMDHPVCIHPFLGSYDRGECYAPETYELIPPNDSSGRNIEVPK
jgi:hypothetical protein